jgi:hypothetical protein
MTPIQTAMVVASIVAQWACGGAGAPATPPKSSKSDERWNTAPSPFLFRLQVPAAADAGSSVKLRLVLTNAADTTVKVEIFAAPWEAYDFVVARQDGSEVWRRVPNNTPLATMGKTVVLAAGDSLVLDHTWDQRDEGGRPVAAGTYQVRGILIGAIRPPGIQAGPEPLTIR